MNTIYFKKSFTPLLLLLISSPSLSTPTDNSFINIDNESLVEYTAIDEEIREVNDLNDYYQQDTTGSIADFVEIQDGELFNATQSIQNHVNNIADLNSKIKKITIDLDAETKSNNKLSTEVGILKDNAKTFEMKLHDALKVKENEKAAQILIIRDLTDKNSVIKSVTANKIKSHLDSISKLNSEIARINKQLNENTQDNTQLTQKLKTLTEISETVELKLRSSIQDKEKSLSLLNSSLIQLKASSSKDSETSSKAISGHLASISVLTTEIKALNNELKGQISSNMSLSDQITILTSRINTSEAKLKQTLTAKELQATMHTSAIKELTTSKDGELSTASQKIQQHLDNITQLNSEVSSLNINLNSEIQSNTVLAEELNSLTEKTKSVEASLKQSLAEKEILANDHVLAIKELTSSKDGELTIASQKIQQHIDNIAELSSENNYLKKLSTTEFFSGELEKNRLQMIERKIEIKNISKFFSTELSTLKTDLTDKNAKLTKLNNKINYLLEVQTTSKVQYKKDLDQITSEKDNLIISLKSSQIKSKSLISEIDEMSISQKQQAKDQIASLLAKTKEINSLNDKINSFLSLTSSTNSDFDKEIKSLQYQKTILNKSLSKAKSNIKDLNSSIASMKKSTLVTKAKHLDDLLTKSQKIDSLNEKISSLLSLTSASTKKLDTTISNLTTAKTKLEKSLSSLKAQHEQLVADHKSAKSQNSISKQKITELVTAVAKLKNIANNKGATISALSEQLQEISANKEALEKQLVSYKSLPNPKIDEYINKMDVLKTQTTNKIQELKGELLLANNSVADLEAKLMGSVATTSSNPASNMKSLFAKLNKNSMPQSMKNSMSRYLSSRTTPSTTEQSVERYKKRIDVLTVSLGKSEKDALLNSSSLRKQIQKSKNKISDLTRKINNSYNSNVQISSALKRDIASYKLQISDLNDRLKFSNTRDLSVPALKNDIESYKKQISTLSRTIDELTPISASNFSHLKKDNAKYKKQIADLTKRLGKFTLYPTTNEIVITPANRLITERDNLIKLLITEEKHTKQLTELNHSLSSKLYTHNNSLSDIISNLNQKDTQITVLLSENKKSIIAFDIMQNNLMTINDKIANKLDAAKSEIAKTETTLRKKISQMIYNKNFAKAKNLIDNTKGQTKFSFDELSDFTIFFTSIEGYRLGLVATADVSKINDKALQEFLIQNAIVELSEKSLLLDFVSIIRYSTILKDDKHRQLIDLFTKINEYTKAIRESIEIQNKSKQDLIMLTSITHRLTSIETMFHQIINQ